MRITGVEVKALFGVFNHRISFSGDPRITIIHGQNGTGKTVLLNLIRAVCDGDWAFVRTIPFESFDLELEGDSRLVVSRGGSASNELESIPLKVRLLGTGKTHTPIEVPGVPDFRQLPFPPSAIEDIVPSLERVGPDRWRTRNSNRSLTWPEVFNRYGVALGLSPAELRAGSWLSDLQETLSVHLVSTDRLWRPRRPRPRPLPRHGTQNRDSVAAVHSDDMANRIREALTEYAEKSQQLERTFSRRLLSMMNEPEDLDPSEVIDEINELENKRSRVMAAGLLDQDEEFSPLQRRQRLDGPVLQVLSLYAADGRDKLGVFDELLRPVELFVRLVGSKFLAKAFGVSKDGFVVRAAREQDISVESLSSGEQHELVLMYELIFLTCADSLVMIDEPELSLDVVWQRAFTRDLAEVTDLRKFDVLLATHSPQIVGKYTQQLVELG